MLTNEYIRARLINQNGVYNWKTILVILKNG